ncbi:unnamed protein product [Fusarium graminearum]|uniref:Uncharacterized protein n=1 Tax=Gibberella zeae TaxID=5518 RepID=A0A4U9F802_GIBZA|nr:unnamed protein product [Fusarium graminearum]
MDVIDEFITKFQHERDQWELLKDRAIEICNSTLRDINTIGIVTGRVKTAESLRKKLNTRNASKRYLDEDSVLKDQLDFVGLRIALYFPSQKQHVFTQLQEVFRYEALRPFDRDWKPREPGIYQNIFGQYVADHLWVSLRTEDQGLAGPHAKQPFEIQLRSVLMDAWAGISHDLQYKALSGHLTGTELKLLDALKGHVEVGELMLEQLYQVHRKRIETEKEPIPSVQDLRYIILDSIPGVQASEVNLGDLNALFLVLQAFQCANPHTVRVLLHEYTKANLRLQLDVFEQTFDPLPATISFFLLEKLLSHVKDHSQSFRQVAEVIRARQQRPLHDSRYWQSLLWLSCQILDRAKSRNVFPSGAQVRKYAYIWCTEHHHRPPLSLARSDDNLIQCLAIGHEHPARGLEFLAELSFLGLGPTVPEYMEVHDAGHEDNRFNVIAKTLLLLYERYPEEWKEAISEYTRSLSEVDATTNRFLHLVDVATWLMSIRAREHLVHLLDIWPLDDDTNVWDNLDLQSGLETTKEVPSGLLLQLLKGEKHGYFMLKEGESNV